MAATASKPTTRDIPDEGAGHAFIPYPTGEENLQRVPIHVRPGTRRARVADDYAVQGVPMLLVFDHGKHVTTLAGFTGGRASRAALESVTSRRSAA